ncbi:peptidylprolyl isomerase [Nesterenkonia sp. MY13]|uniref:Peptidylprolyl isomerase n=1 Tax=Nesterenkonia sedimenti TaxID=1463632 RepID=A0A7X8TI24_9MICC|nr:SurA N-terminal domain-containing protein [Nesterenkonia sedimenti]NLS09138.1 peptidylprolyl isomerase [Nesterenkonia sedimenti]
MHNTQKKLVTSVAAAALLFGLAACDEQADDAETSDEEANAQEAEVPEGAEEGEAAPEGEGEMEDPMQDMPEPDLEDVPDVVAEVNGEEITGEEFATAYESQFMEMAMQAQMTGEEVDEEELQEQTLDGMIGVELLNQEAEAEGIEASEEDIDAELDELAEMNQMESVDELMDMAEEQGASEEQLREDVAQQVRIDALAEGLDVEEPTDEEIEETYEQQIAEQEAMQEMQEAEGEGEEDAEAPEVPDLEEMRPQLEEQLTEQKQNEAITAHMEQLRGEADVEVHI